MQKVRSIGDQFLGEPRPDFLSVLSLAKAWEVGSDGRFDAGLPKPLGSFAVLQKDCPYLTGGTVSLDNADSRYLSTAEVGPWEEVG